MKTAHYNPPGLTAIAYRAATYTTALQRLKTYITQRRNQDPGLRMLALYADDSWAIALLEAWAMLVDILSFYQERIANEGYLPTATELRSVQELVSAIGYEPRPGVAASTYLAFTVRHTATPPYQRSVIPARTVVQSLPSQVQPLGLPTDMKPPPVQLPPIFETEADFEARVEWNALRPSTIAFKSDHIIRSDLMTLRLAGASAGLKPGDVLLIVGENTPGASTQQPAWMLATLTDVAPNRERGYTQVAWQAEARGAHDLLLHNPQVFALRQKAALYSYQSGGVYYSPLDAAHWTPSSIGLPAPVYAITASKTGALLAGTDSGVYRSVNNGESWDAARAGLMNSKISALTTSSEGRLYAGSSGGNVFCSSDNGDNWKLLVSKAPRRTTLLGLALPGQPLASVSLPRGVIRRIAAFTADRTHYLAVAMDEGVFLSSDQGGSWQRLHPGQFGKNSKSCGGAWSFATAHKDGRTFVGTDSGVFPLDTMPLPPAWWSISLTCIIGAMVLLALIGLGHVLGVDEAVARLSLTISAAAGFIAQRTLLLFIVLLAICLALLGLLLWWHGSRWLERRRPQPPGAIRALSIEQDNTLLAGTGSGIYRAIPTTKSWSPVEQGPDIRILQAGTAEYLLAGSHDGRIFRSLDKGTSWQDYTPLSPFTAVEDLAVQGHGIFAAGSVANGATEGLWSRFHLQKKQLYLDKLYPTLSAGGWIVLQQDAQPAALYKVEAVASAATGDYKKHTRVTCVTVDRSDNLAAFDRRRATLFVQSEPLTLYNDEAVEGDTLLLDTAVPDLAPGHRLIVSGKRPRVRILDESSQNLFLVSADGLQQVPFDQNDTYVLMASPSPQPSSASTWHLRNSDGFTGSVTTSADSIVVYEPANDDDESIGEMVTLKMTQKHIIIQQAQQKEQTLLSFQSPLQNAYDRSTVTIYANTVYATHGQTVANEVLGNSASPQNTYRYTLKQKPLTYVPAPTPEGIQSTLTVQVDQVRWRQVVTIQELNTTRRSYLLRRDSQGNTIIYFGTGSQRVDLPAGSQQITATYRIGIGEAGNVDASTLTLLRTRPSGVQRVTNPIAASGGADPDSMEQMRALAPLQIRTMQRIISLNDYENFTRMFAGIGKVQARALEDGHKRFVHLTVAGVDGATVAKGSKLFTTLLDGIRRSSSSPTQPVYLDSFEALYFHITARLLIDPDWREQKATIQAQAVQKIGSTYSFAQRDLAQDLTASEVIALLQSIPGVLAVELERLSPKDDPANAIKDVLEAKPGRIEDGKILPAQMLVVDTTSHDGIIVEV